MSKRRNGTDHERDDSFEALTVEVPQRPTLLPLDPVLESLADLAGRRDALRMLAQHARDEANRLERELGEALNAHKRALASLAAQVGQA